jgi:hypothetical protein
VPLGLVIGALVALAAAGCQPAQCGARNEPCCPDATCLDGMVCNSGVCRGPCLPEGAACDLVTGAGCGAGTICRPVLAGEDIVAACVAAVPGSQRLDDGCATTEECGVGLYCYFGRCRFHCCAERDCPANQFCSAYDTAGFCSGADGCDIFGPGCVEGEGCYPIVLERGGISPTCFRAGARQVGDPCTSSIVCAPGHVCIGNELSAACARMCDAWHPCDVGQCLGIVGDPGYGFCG